MELHRQILGVWNKVPVGARKCILFTAAYIILQLVSITGVLNISSWFLLSGLLLVFFYEFDKKYYWLVLLLQITSAVFTIFEFSLRLYLTIPFLVIKTLIYYFEYKTILRVNKGEIINTSTNLLRFLCVTFSFHFLLSIFALGRSVAIRGSWGGFVNDLLFCLVWTMGDMGGILTVCVSYLLIKQSSSEQKILSWKTFYKLGLLYLFFFGLILIPVFVPSFSILFFILLISIPFAVTITTNTIISTLFMAVVFPVVDYIVININLIDDLLIIVSVQVAFVIPLVVILIVGIITEEKAVQSKQYELLYNESPDALFFIDYVTGELSNLNKVFVQLFSRSVEAGDTASVSVVTASSLTRPSSPLPQKNTNEFADYISSLPRIKTVLETFKNDPEKYSYTGEFEFELEVGNVEGTITKKNHWFLLSLFRFTFYRKELKTQLRGLLRDITAVKHAEIRANIASMAKSTFLANMSHEIRTPMNGVNGMLTLLKTKTKLDSKQLRYVDICERSGKALMSILDDILTFTKSESGKIVLEKIEFSPIKVITDVVNSMEGVNTNLECLMDVSKDFPKNAIGDPGRLRQILYNLVNNAYKFTERGHIVVKARKLETLSHSEINFHEGRGSATSSNTSSSTTTASNSRRHHLYFEIRDTGIGIEQELIPKLFKPFTQEDASTTRKYGGTGLGLALCHQFVNLYGGSIGVESIKYVGSKFYFDIYVDESQSDQPGEQNPEEVTLKKILIVDDNATNLEILYSMFEGNGNVIVSFSDPVKCIKSLQEQQDNDYDFALIDYVMPGMNGAELIKFIHTKLAPSYSKLPCIILSSSHVTIEEISELEHTTSLSKPTEYATLVNTIHSLCGHDDQENGDSGGGTNKKSIDILIAEDNRFNMTLIEEIVSKITPNYKKSFDGIECIASLRKFHPRVTLLDIHMPGANGIDVLKEINERGIQTIVLVMTADITEELKNKLAEFGSTVSGVIYKPVNVTELESKLTELLKFC